MRSSGSDNTVTVRPPRSLSLDQSLEFISEDELVEVTPKAIRMRKMELDQQKRESIQKKERLSDQHKSLITVFNYEIHTKQSNKAAKKNNNIDWFPKKEKSTDRGNYRFAKR